MKKNWLGVYQFLKSIIHGYREDDCYHFAAVVSFYAIFSMLPLAIITVAVLAYALGSSAELIQHFQVLIQSIVPTAAEQLFLVMRSAFEKGQRFSLISAGILILIASLLFSALESALDRVFRIEKKRNFFHSKIIAIGFLFIFILLFAAPGIVQLLQSGLVSAGLLKGSMVFALSGDVFFFFVAFGAFFLATTVIPNHKVYMRYSFIGAIVFTFLTGIARLLFRYYIAVSWNRYDLIYDSLTVLIVIIVWIYYLANIFLLCAEFVARLQEGRISPLRRSSSEASLKRGI